MKCLYYILLLLILSSNFSAFSQTFTVSGTVESKNGIPIEFANVILTANNTPKVEGVVSKENGKFEIDIYVAFLPKIFKA